jgi:aldehyde dehydrogenase (NAD+)
VAGSRLIVERSAAPRLIDGIASAFATLKPGHTWASGTTLPPIISARQAQRIDGIVARSVQQGAQIAAGGSRLAVAGEGAFYAPTIREEVFGPVLTVQTFDDEDEALALASHEKYGLAAGVHTSDLSRALRAMRSIEAGTVWINRYGRTSDFVIPTGGYKQSGLGKDLGRQAFEANLRFKSVLIDLNQGA